MIWLYSLMGVFGASGKVEPAFCPCYVHGGFSNTGSIATHTCVRVVCVTILPVCPGPTQFLCPYMFAGFHRQLKKSDQCGHASDFVALEYMKAYEYAYNVCMHDGTHSEFHHPVGDFSEGFRCLLVHTGYTQADPAILYFLLYP